MIQSFADKDAERCFYGQPVQAGWQNIQRVVGRKLIMLHAAVSLRDLASPPNNKLEALKKERSGQHAIRVSDQWRLCFVWKDDGPHAVEVADYH